MKNFLSASKVKTFLSCSALYYYQYIEKIPRGSNAGAERGTICHDIFELLLDEKHRGIVDTIIRTNKIPLQIVKLLSKKLSRVGYFTTDNIEKCKKFILTGVLNDFYCSGGQLKEPETYFEISEPFKAKGYIDKHALYTDFSGQLYVEIIDYKSQKSKFSDSELLENIQGFMYLYAAKQLYPNINLLKSKVKFILLDYPEDPIQDFSIKSLADMDDFINMMEGYQGKIDAFNESNIGDNLAYNKGYPKDGSFGGILMCGKGVTKPGELKKDGTPKYYCPFKFPFTFYVLVDEEGKIVERSHTKLKSRDNLKAERRFFSGCCAHNDVPLNNGKDNTDLL